MSGREGYAAAGAPPRTVKGLVVRATFGADPRARLTAAEGWSVEVSAPADIQPYVSEGAAVLIYVDAHERVLGWSLPDLNTGVIEPRPSGAPASEPRGGAK